MVTTVVRRGAPIEMPPGRPLYSVPVWSSRWTPASPGLFSTTLPGARCLQDWANFLVSRPSPSLKKSFVCRPVSSEPSRGSQQLNPNLSQPVTRCQPVTGDAASQSVWHSGVLISGNATKNNVFSNECIVFLSLATSSGTHTSRQGPSIDKGLNWCCVIF